MELDGFRHVEKAHELGDLPQRTTVTYRGRDVWVEWKDNLVIDGLYPHADHSEIRIGLLTDLLCHVKPIGFRAPPCLGYIKIQDSELGPRLGIVFENPPIHGTRSELITLQSLLGQGPKPSLSVRLSLCAVLARCLYSFHSVNWMHKGLRSDNVIFFASSSASVDLSSPYVSGFDLSRPSSIDTMTEKPGFNPVRDIYRHPDAQSGQTDGNFRKCYDIYSLGVVIIEVLLWKHIGEVAGFKDISKVKPSTLQGMQSWLLARSPTGQASLPLTTATSESCLQRVASEGGDVLRDIVKYCLTADEVEQLQYPGEPPEMVVVRLQRVAGQDIVKRLESIPLALQG
ncbi:hypothetical protein RRF57_009330 [Xylaria bambusicola]|uniref:DUF7580 domain-containing protein n=1 Tax=Xylaria bambusicola TaxID=326684 RepID=A0AAN7UVC9_9PEZI